MTDVTGACPVVHGGHTSMEAAKADRWPNALNLDLLAQHDTKTNPMGPSSNCRQELKTLGVEAPTKDVK